MRKIRILVVDDDERNVVLLTSKLKSDGYETDEANDGSKALKKVESFNPDLILLDIMMPKIDGYEVTRRLKASEKTKYIPVVMLTARGEIEDKVLGLDIGAEEYLCKPYSLAEVTARVRSLLHMKELQMKLVEMEKLAALGHLVDGIAHEIRNPLATIGGLARRVKEKIEDEQIQGHINLIIHEVERLENMVKRVDEYKMAQHSELKNGDMNEIIRESVENIKDAILAKNIGVKLSLMQDIPIMMIDRVNLKKAILNILQNSIDAIDKKGEIEITTMPSAGGYIELIIKDTGCGISDKDLKDIFNPFYTSRMTGAGLGLTIAYKIIQDHRGDITIESLQGRGTIVSIKLPVGQK